MVIKKSWIGSKKVATQGDLSDLHEVINGEMAQMEERLTKRLDDLEGRMDRLETRMDALETRMDALETRMDALETRMDALENKMDKMQHTLETMLELVQGVDQRTRDWERRLTKLEMRR